VWDGGSHFHEEEDLHGEWMHGGVQAGGEVGLWVYVGRRGLGEGFGKNGGDVVEAAKKRGDGDGV